jgi:hypothetical protein
MKLPVLDVEPEEVVVDGTTTVGAFLFPMDPERDDEADAWRCSADDERDRGRDKWSACDETRSDIYSVVLRMTQPKACRICV